MQTMGQSVTRCDAVCQKCPPCSTLSSLDPATAGTFACRHAPGWSKNTQQCQHAANLGSRGACSAAGDKRAVYSVHGARSDPHQQHGWACSQVPQGTTHHFLQAGTDVNRRVAWACMPGPLEKRLVFLGLCSTRHNRQQMCQSGWLGQPDFGQKSWHKRSRTCTACSGTGAAWCMCT
jgi:hypothetical protein